MRQIVARLMGTAGLRWRNVAAISSTLHRVAGQWYSAGGRVAMAMTSTRSEGGKAPWSSRPRSILKPSQPVLNITGAPEANGMAVTVQLGCHPAVGRLLWRCGSEDQPTPKG